MAVAEHMREGDRAEVWAIGRHSPEQATAMSLAASSEAWAFLADGAPMAVFGVSPIPEHALGSPWLLGADGVERFARPFINLGRGFVGRWVREYGYLYNVADRRNVRSLRWLTRLGFTFLDPMPLGPDGRLFVPFEMRS